MNFFKKPTLIGFLFSTLLIFTLGNGKQVYGQEESAPLEEVAPVEEVAPIKQILQIQIGPHPEYTRLLVDIKGQANYEVNANFAEKKN